MPDGGTVRRAAVEKVPLGKRDLLTAKASCEDDANSQAASNSALPQQSVRDKSA